MVELMHINDTYGHSAGDIAIAECLRRIDEAAGDDMLPIRIGGGEFVLSALLPEKGNIRYNELFDSFIIAGRASET